MSTTTTILERKVFVCKYVRTPGQPEVLQSGGNPISVDIHSIPDPENDGVHIGDEFSDAQQRSIVIAFDTGQPEPDPSVCPPPGGGTTTTSSSTSTTGAPTSTTTSVPVTTPETGPTTSTSSSTSTSTTTAPPTTTSTVPATTSSTTTTSPPTTSTSTTTSLPPTTTTTEVPTSTTTTTPPTSTTTTSPPTTSTSSTSTLPATTSTSTTTPTTTSTSTTTIPPTTTSASTTSTSSPVTESSTTTTSGPSTTSSTSTTTTTSVPTENLDVAALVPQCIGDAPYIRVDFGNQPQFNGFTATITFISQVTGLVVSTAAVPYQANSSVFIIYPGATVDAAGIPTDWPGWRFEESTQLWVPDPSDDYLREGLIVTIEVNPTASATVEYPPATAACASPDNPPPGTSTTVPGGSPGSPGSPGTPIFLPPTQ